MSIARIYQAHPLTLYEHMHLDERAMHYVARVLRAKCGDMLTLFNGEGGEYTASITRIDKKQIEVEVSAFLPREAESPVHICLAQGIARGEKMDWIIQKAVELGVNQIVPLLTERSNVHFNQAREEKRLQHWRQVVISACEQSGRNRLPSITPPFSLIEWLPQVTTDRRFVLSPHVQQALPYEIKPVSIALLIGPEGGLSEDEINQAIAHQFSLLNLGPRVLRTETAPLAAITLIQACYGDMNDSSYFL